MDKVSHVSYSPPHLSLTSLMSYLLGEEVPVNEPRIQSS